MLEHRAEKPAMGPVPTATKEGGDPYAAAREEMIEHQLRRRGVVMHSVLEAMREVPRHLFVSHEYADRAYEDEALPTIAGQTISQPYMVAIMTQELTVHQGQRVLEIGTGTGYQTAILAYLVGETGEVFTVEREEALATFARHRLEAMGIRNVRYLVGDGSGGWPAEGGAGAEFDRIMVTAGTPAVPRPLLGQLADAGILVVPVGTSDVQTLVRVVRRGRNYQETELMGCRFVPLVGKYGWDVGNYDKRQWE